MSRRSPVFALAAAGALLLAPSPPEPPTASWGDAVAGAEAAGVDATEWEALMRGSATSGSGKGGLQALLEAPNVDQVVFYKNLNESFAPEPGGEPAISGRRPVDAPACSPGFPLDVLGVGFAPGAVELWKGAARPTIFVSETMLQARLLDADLAAAGVDTFVVVNPGGIGSNMVSLTVTP